MHAVKNIGAQILVLAALPALANSAGTRNGSAITRTQSGSQAKSATVVVNTGATTGGPSAQTLDVKLQHSADGSTGWTDVPDAAITQKTSATAALASFDVDLSLLNEYLRVVEVTALTGGTSPTTPNAVDLILGGFDRLPA